MKKRCRTFFDSLGERARLRWLVLLATTLLITVLLFPSLWRSTPSYYVGDVARNDIKSPRDLLIEDKEATSSKRQEAAQSVLTVYDFDDTLAAKLSGRVGQAFQHIVNLGAGTEHDPSSGGMDGVKNQQALSGHDLIWKEKATFEDILGIEVSDTAYKVLEKEKFSESIPKDIGRVLDAVFQNGIVGNRQVLLQQPHNGIVVRQLSSRQEDIVTNLEDFFGPDEAKAALAKAGQTKLQGVDNSLRKVMVDMAQRMMQPNLTLNRGETEERRSKAVADVKPVLTQVKKGEMLVREGEKITLSHRAKLDALESEMGRGELFAVSAGFLLLAIIFFVISFTVHLKPDARPGLNNKDLLFLCVMLVVIFLLSEVSTFLVNGIVRNIPYAIEVASALYAIPAASGAMTVCLFMGMEVALPFSLAVAFTIAFLFENQFQMFLFFLLSGMVGAHSVRTCKERGTLIEAGVKVGLVNAMVITAIYMSRGSGLQLQLFWDWVLGLLGGVISGMLTTGLAPVIEMTFAYTTDIKLLELGSLDRPLLRKLMMEAPGTYHHSVIVGSLVEAAATAIGANPLLAKVSGYYHDIGKIKKPLYFIENQFAGENRHDRLAPSMSSLILTSHVRDGVEIAKRYRLGQVIVDIIQQHHGTSLISYFYEKAKKVKGEGCVNIEHFRHSGPKPQTKEAGLVLLADSVEAASRSLDNPTPVRIKGLVQRIINNMLLDGQLDECELSLKEINEIIESFNKTLNGIYHNRIEYPNGDALDNKANGDSDRRQTKPSSDRSQRDRGESEASIKRLRVT